MQVADPGSVLFNFQRQGLVMVDGSEGEDAVFEAAMEAGAADIQQHTDEDGAVVGFKVGGAGGRAGHRGALHFAAPGMPFSHCFSSLAPPCVHLRCRC